MEPVGVSTNANKIDMQRVRETPNAEGWCHRAVIEASRMLSCICHERKNDAGAAVHPAFLFVSLCSISKAEDSLGKKDLQGTVETQQMMCLAER